MVGLKRTRPRQDSEASDVETASSHLRHEQNGRKRSRLTPVNGDSEDDDLELNDAHQNRRAREDTEEEEDSDPSDSEVSGRVARMRARGELPENHAAECGIIEEVNCKNFMCHSNTTIKLGPQINFVIGHNGSGKSAVLTALQICLGGKATASNRAQSLKNLIKSGAEQCTLTVKIRNRGELAYKPELYPGVIVVERSFNRSGTSGFKLKDGEGHIKSTKKADLEDILDALALMMDNPMNVLTQDKAREFLNSSNARDKYKFFYQGTQLEQLDFDYRVLEESLDMNIKLEEDLENLAKAAREKYELAEQKATLAEQAQGLQDRYNTYSRQMIWSQVGDEEIKLATAEEDLRRRAETIEQRKTAAEQLDADMERFNKERDDAKEALETIQAELATKTGERDAVREKFDAIKDRLKEYMSEHRDIRSELEKAQKTVKTLENDIEKEKEKIASADNGRHAQKMEEIQSAEEKLESMRQQVQDKSAQSRPLDAAVRDAESALQDAKDAMYNSGAAVKSIQNRIAAFEREQGDWREAYSPRLKALLSAIERETRFREKPVGPLGRYIRLLKGEWADILEKQAGGALNAFAVSHKADQGVLSDLMRRSNYDAQIFVTTTRSIDTTQQEPSEEYDTWLRALRIDNVLVRNCLVINQGIEKVVLEKDPERGRQLVIERRPGVNRVFAMNPIPGEGNSKWGYNISLTSGGNEASQPIPPWKGGARMQTDSESQVASEHEKLARQKSQLHDLEASYREAQTKVTQTKQAVQRHLREMKALNLSIQGQEVTLQDLKNELEADTPQEQVLEGLEVNLRDAQRDVETYSNQYGDAVLEKDKLNAEQRPVRAQLNELQDELDDLAARITSAEEALHDVDDARKSGQLKANESHEAINDAERDRAQSEERRDRQLHIVQSFTEQAEGVCLRVAIEPEHTTDSLDALLVSLKRELLRQQDRAGGDRDTLVLKKLEAKVEWDSRQRAFQGHVNVVGTLKQALDNRQERWKKFRDLISGRAKHHFGWLLGNRRFRGELKILHEERTLDINVQPDAAAKTNRGRQTKTLSGGEKSFSTICLLLALWEAMGSPVRCLDEFDVFMDQINRDISMNMMIDAARRSVARQFLFITPQSMNNVKIMDDVRIHKMSDPERGQTTLSQFVR